jgi:hypothetical protein
MTHRWCVDRIFVNKNNYKKKEKTKFVYANKTKMMIHNKGENYYVKKYF